MADIDGGTIDHGVVLGLQGGTVFRSKNGSAVNLGVSGSSPDETSPVVDNFSPANGSTIEALDPLFFDITDNLAELGGVFIYVDPGDGTADAVYDLAAGSFLGTYANLSTTTSIVGGLRFEVRKFEGWSGPVTITIRVFDNDGNVNV